MAQIDDVFQLRAKQFLRSSTLLSCGFTLGFIRSPKTKLQDFSAFHAKTLQSLFSKIKSIHYQLFTVSNF
jgi:hypothetical protein